MAVSLPDAERNRLLKGRSPTTSPVINSGNTLKTAPILVTRFDSDHASLYTNRSSSTPERESVCHSEFKSSLNSIVL